MFRAWVIEHSRGILEENDELCFFHSSAYVGVRKHKGFIFALAFLKILILKGCSCICIIPDPYCLHVYRALKILQWLQILKISCPKVSASLSIVQKVPSGCCWTWEVSLMWVFTREKWKWKMLAGWRARVSGESKYSQRVSLQQKSLHWTKSPHVMIFTLPLMNRIIEVRHYRKLDTNSLSTPNKRNMGITPPNVRWILSCHTLITLFK